MKKRMLLLLLTMLVSVVSTWAQDATYVYTANGRYKLVGENLLTNGNFSNGLEGWMSADGIAINNACLSAEKSFIDNSPYLHVNIKRDASLGGGIYQSVAVEANTQYVVTYRVQGFTTSRAYTKAGSDNYQNVFFNTDGLAATVSGEGVVQLAESYLYGEEWQQVVYAYQGEAGHIVINFSRLTENDNFADFGVYQAEEVSDDRKVQAMIDRFNELLANPLFPEGHNILENRLKTLNNLLAVEEMATVENALFNMESAVDKFYEANSLDVTSYVPCGNFYDATPSGNGMVTTVGTNAWKATGGRWMIKSSSDSEGLLSSTFVRREINGKNSMPAGAIEQTVSLPAGTYMLSMEMLARKYTWSDATIDDAASANIKGIYLYINDEELECIGLKTGEMTNFTVYAEVEEGQDLTIGVRMDEKAANSLWLANTVLRLIGGNEEDVKTFLLNKELESSRAFLKGFLDEAALLLNDDTYIFGIEDLKAKNTEAQNMYDNGTEKGELNRLGQELRTAIATFRTLNREYHPLAAHVKRVKAMLANEAYKKGKDEMQQALTDPEAYLATYTATTTADSAALATKDAALVIAINKFMSQNASYNLPADLILNNADFALGTKGWDINIDPIKKAVWALTSDSRYENGQVLLYSRGRSAADPMFALQSVPVTGNGYYELTAEIVAYNNEWAYDAPTGVKLVLAGDSLNLRTDAVGTPVKVTLGKTVKDSTAITIGLDARNNKRCCIIGISNVKLTFFGDYDQFKKDSIAAAVEPAREELTKTIDHAVALKNSVRNPNNVSTSVYDQAISKAEGIKANSNDLNELIAAVPELEQAEETFKLSGVWPAEGEYFDFTYLIQSNDFGGDGAASIGWTIEGDQPIASENHDAKQPYLSYYFGGDATRTTTVSQTLANMPAGAYELKADATYRLDLTSNFNFADYEGQQPVSLFANQDTVKVKGLLEGADQLYVENTLNYSLDDYRHGRNIDVLFNAGFYTTTLKMNTTAAGDLKVGITAEDIKIRSGLFVDSFTLRFYGDDPTTTGIDYAPSMAVKEADNSIYTLTGAKIRYNATSLSGLQKGLYIWKGKKYQVK